MDLQRKRYERMVEKAVREAQRDPLVRAHLAGLRGQEREDRFCTIVAGRLRTDPRTRPLMDAIGMKLARVEMERMAEEVLEEQVALGKRRRATDPVTGQTVYVLAEGPP
jgi:hypothetical protein